MKKTILIILLIVTASSTILAQAPINIPEKPEVVFVQGGTFQMGSILETDEQPVHKVSLSSFSIGKYEVTVGQYKAFCTATGRAMPEAPRWGWQDDHPMLRVNYDDALSFCNWLGKKFGGVWRLPTEAEWEYAARGGKLSKGTEYSGGTSLNPDPKHYFSKVGEDNAGWYSFNCGSKPQSVGTKNPNELGIYDMSGNVYEWCMDWYGREYYKSSPTDNPKGPTNGQFRVVRGGSWSSGASDCRVTNRGLGISSDRSDFNGFRVVLSQ